MRKRLEMDDGMVKRHIDCKGALDDEEMDLKTNFDTVFKHLFCVTAQELADQLRTPLADLGVLHDDILMSNTTIDLLSSLVSKDPPMNRRGKMLFAVRHLDKQEATRFEASGFRFACPHHIVPPLARSIRVTPSALDTQIRDMRDYATAQRSFEPGVHLTSFVMRPTVQGSSTGLEILTAKGTGNPLPSVTFPVRSLGVPQMRLLSRMNGWSIVTCMNWLTSDCAQKAYGDMDDFRTVLLDAMDELSTTIPSDLHSGTRFTGRPHLVPCRATDGRLCTILSFCVMGNLETRISNPNYSFTPLSIFRAEQQMNDRRAEDRDIASKELSIGCLQLSALTQPSQAHSNNERTNNSRIKSPAYSRHPREILSHLLRTKLRDNNPRLSPATSESSSSTELEDDRRSLESLDRPPPTPVGDITVSKEVRVDVSSLDDALAQRMRMQESESHTTVAAGDAAVSSGTYVDDLCNLCSNAPGIRLRPDSIFENHTE